jgi:hypothetical protein
MPSRSPGFPVEVSTIARRAGGMMIPIPAPSRTRAATNCHSSVATANHSSPAADAATPVRSSSAA